MPTTKRSRTIRATPAELWAIVGDPYHLPRWWPRVIRVEAVDAGAFTQVLTTERGHTVRADFRLTALEEPERVAWAQDLAGTPFERVLDTSTITITLRPDGAGTKVVLEQRQKMRGLSKLGGVMIRKAAREVLDDALDGLQRLHEA